MSKDQLRVAAMGDLHCKRSGRDKFRHMFGRLEDRADVLLLCGDLTDSGDPDEARVLMDELAPTGRMPKLAVLGNHDFEAGKQDAIRQILVDGGIVVMDGETIEIGGVGFAGIKGFAGGFGRNMLEPWGEERLKFFVDEAVRESLKLESALAKLQTPVRIVLMHYAPIKETLVGESPEIFPFLGCSRLEEPLNRYGAAMVFHGHAHHGSPEGRTREGIPVYNVASPLLRQLAPDADPLRVVPVDVTP